MQTVRVGQTSEPNSGAWVLVITLYCCAPTLRVSTSLWISLRQNSYRALYDFLSGTFTSLECSGTIFVARVFSRTADKGE